MSLSAEANSAYSMKGYLFGPEKEKKKEKKKGRAYLYLHSLS